MWGSSSSCQSEYLGANYDFGNNLSFMEDPTEMAEAVAPYVKAAHIKDVGVQRYPDGFLMSEAPLGEGMLDLPKIMGALAKQLARTLRLVGARQSPKPLPVVDKLPRAEREKLETDNVKACLRYGKKHLNL